MTHESAEKQARQLEKKLVFDVRADWLKTKAHWMHEYFAQENALLKALQEPKAKDADYYFDLAKACKEPGQTIRIRTECAPDVKIRVGSVPDLYIIDDFETEYDCGKDRRLLLCPVK